jgi:chloramphenicol O-acetyltransferase type B
MNTLWESPGSPIHFCNLNHKPLSETGTAMTILKDTLKYALYKRRYSGSSIALGSTVAGDSLLGSQITIEKNCYVFRSNIGDNVRIHEGCNIFDSKLEGNNVLYKHNNLSGVKIGAYSYLNEGANMANITIGRFCSVGPEFMSGFGVHPTNFVSTSPVFYSTRRQCGVTFADKNYFEEQKQTNIGHDVWIGSRVWVKDGVTIGNGVIIGAGAVVTQDVPDYSITGGVPAKHIRFRFSQEIIEELLEIQWWHWPEGKLREAQALFAQPEAETFLQWNRSQKLK